MRKITYMQALQEAHMEEMKRDESIFLMGIELRHMGSGVGQTAGLYKEFGPDRIFDTPISESGYVGVAVGLAFGGVRTIVEVQFADFLSYAFDSIVNQAAKMRYLSDGKASVPLVIRSPQGMGFFFGAQHSQCVESWFMNVPGLKIAIPSNAYDAKGLLKTAIRDDDPVLFLEHKACIFMKGEVPEEEYNKDKNSGLTVELLNFRPIDRPDDTIKAVEMMKNLDISCLIVLGGDGTCRLVAKTDIDVPIIPVSTGTNNVYPQFYEGTTVGIAASYISLNRGNYDLDRSKRIEVYINGKFSDIALVDAVITDLPYVGSKVVSETQNIKELIVSMCSPVSVGFSSIAGNITICNEDHDFGYRIKFDDFGIKIFAPVSPGNVEEVSFSELERMDIDYEYFSLPNYDGTIALDGERTISFRYGDQLKFKITRKGPYKVDILKILSRAVENKFFHLNT